MSPTSRPGHLRAGAIALFVTFLWSSSWVLVRWGLDGESLEPITFAALRYGLAATVLVGWVVGHQPLRVSVRRIVRADLFRIVALGIVFYAVTQGSQFIAIDSQPAATTSVVLSWTPLLVAFGALSIGERSSKRQLLGAGLVAGGAWCYFSGALGVTTVGMVAAVVSLLANSASALLGRSINRMKSMAPEVITALSMSIGAVILIAAGLTIEGAPSVSARGWIIIAWLAVVNTAVAFSLWNLSLRKLSALESSAINNTMLIQIAALGWIFLDEPLGLAELGGIMLVSLGVLLAQTRPKDIGAG